MTDYSKRTCSRASDGWYTCDSITFPVSGGEYSQVCSKIKAYQRGWTEGFAGYGFGHLMIPTSLVWLLCMVNLNRTLGHLHEELLKSLHIIRESVDSLCRDDADMPMPPYIRQACNRPNAAFVSLFRYLTMIYGCFST